jgi:hypothetical protein
MAGGKYAALEAKHINWDKAVAKYEECVNFSCRPLTRKLRPDHIEDEDRSVKWNRQFVEDQNKKHDDEVKSLNRKKNALREEANDMVKFMICEELDWKLTDADVDRLFDRWYSKYHDDGYRYMCHEIENECDDIRKMDWFKSLKVRK